MAQIDVKLLRRKLGASNRPISQDDLAKRLRTTQSMISRFETGENEWAGPVALLLEQLDAETSVPDWLARELAAVEERAA